MKRRVPALIAAAGALVLIVQWANARMLWLDEEMIALNIRERSFARLAGTLSLEQAAPYGWLVCQRAIYLVFGDGERALRFLPVALGVATLVAAAWIARRWMGAAGGAWLALLLVAGQWISFHALELKHYSGDVLFGLLLPALAVWAAEDDPRGRRAFLWWLIAAAAQFLANGAVFVVPACAATLAWVAYRRGGVRDVVRVSWPAAIWLAAFGVNYRITLAPARASTFLRSYWAGGYPPGGAVDATRWIAERMSELVVKPGGSGFGFAFWAVAFAGLLYAPGYPPAFRLVFALVPLSAFVWASLHLVPLLERLAIWIVPSLYVGVGMCADLAASALRDARRSARAGGAVLALVLLALAIDVVRRGGTYAVMRPHIANHSVDDRGAVRWLERQRAPGDVWITVHNAVPAIWWYAPDSRAIIGESIVHDDPSACGESELGAFLGRAGATRVLVYLGFGHDATPIFGDALLGRLGSLGSVIAYRQFGEIGHAAVVDLRQPPSGAVTLEALVTGFGRRPPPAYGCVEASTTRGW